MIRDFWDIKEKRLVDEINALQGKVPTAQWAAIDAVRKIGNIGAHMEKDVNLIIDVEPEEAESLLKLIELLIEKWYISRHDEEILYEEITGAAEEKARPAPEDPVTRRCGRLNEDRGVSYDKAESKMTEKRIQRPS